MSTKVSQLELRQEITRQVSGCIFGVLDSLRPVGPLSPVIASSSLVILTVRKLKFASAELQS